MTRILRSPIIGHQAHQLRHPRGRPAATPTRPAAVPAPEPAPVVPLTVSASVPKIDAETQERLLTERIRKELLEQIRIEAEAAREVGRQRGLREGRDAGLEETRQAMAVEMNRLREVLTTLSAAAETGIRNHEELAVGIAYEAVCRILGDALITREGVLAQVRAAAGRVTSNERLVIRLHPDDLALLQSAGHAEMTLERHASVAWLADAQVGEAGCILETDGSGIDARLETQLTRLRECLLATRHGNSDRTPDDNAPAAGSGV